MLRADGRPASPVTMRYDVARVLPTHSHKFGERDA
jgi:hypothetical protein